MESVRSNALINMATPLKGESHGGRDQPWLSKVSEITSRALPCDASGTERRPVVHICRVVYRHTPGRCFSEEGCRVPDTEIEKIILGRIGAVDVVDRPLPDVLPVEIQEDSGETLNPILRKNIGFVIGNAYKVPVVGCGNSGVGEPWTKCSQAAREHEPFEKPSGKHRLNAIVQLAPRDLKNLAVGRARLHPTYGIRQASNIIRERPLQTEHSR